MIISPAINRILKAIEAAEHKVIQGLQDKTIETEPSLTDRLLGAIDFAFDEGIKSDGYLIRARTLRDRGANAPEAEFGADLASVLHIDTKEYKISKGFLAQAKLANKEGIYIEVKDNRCLPHISLRLSSSSSRLVNQCHRMLCITPESYVFIYSNYGIFVIPASTVVSVSSDDNMYRVSFKTFQWFMKDHLRSFIGDLQLSAYDDDTFRRLRDKTFSSFGLMLDISGSRINKK